MPFLTKGLQNPHYNFIPRPNYFLLNLPVQKRTNSKKSASVTAAFMELLGTLTATNSCCKGIIKADKWLIDISCQKLSQSKGSTRRKRAPCADSVPGFHFTSISLPQSLNPGIGLTVLGNLLIANGVTLAKLVLLVYWFLT